MTKHAKHCQYFLDALYIPQNNNEYLLKHSSFFPL